MQARIFFPIPVAWQNGADAEYLNFDYNGKGIVNISLSTGSAATDTLTKGTKYSYNLMPNTTVMAKYKYSTFWI